MEDTATRSVSTCLNGGILEKITLLLKINLNFIVIYSLTLSKTRKNNFGFKITLSPSSLQEYIKESLIIIIEISLSLSGLNLENF